MTLDEYQRLAGRTSAFPKMAILGPNGLTSSKPIGWVYPVVKLAGEAGELSEKFGKIIRDDNGAVSPEKRDAIKLELGDILWYLAAISREMGFDLSEVAEANIKKLEDRQTRGVIKGSGDYR